VRYTAAAENDRLWLDCEFTSPDGGGYGCVGKLLAKGDVHLQTQVHVPINSNPFSSNEGESAAARGRIDVQHASEVLILLKIDSSKPSAKSRERLSKEIDGVSADYEKLLKAHTAVHREMYERVRLELSDTGAAETSNDALLSEAYKGAISNALTERLYNYGRYLFISSTAPGGWPSNLQGVWNGDYIPAWSSDYTIDENVEMNHWQALPGNLPELTEPYFRYFESTLEDWKENARSFYGCRGAMAPLRQSDNGLMSENMPYLIWTAGAGWIAQLFFDYWLFTGDRKFLAEHAVPFLKEVALFYEDFLYPGPDGKMIVCPSMSPENIPDVPNGTRPSLNPTMDIAVCREVLMSLIAACGTLGSDSEAVARWKALLEKLPAYQINEDGALKEWLYPGLKDNYHHRHLSHLYGLFPGREITPASNPELFRACEVAVEKRLVVGLKSQTSWSLAHMANLYARLHRGEKAIECFDLIARSCLGVNLFTYHNDWRGQGITIHDGKIAPFQIDANMGLTAAVQEMLLFSTPGRIAILPALPQRWKTGRITGLKAHGDITVSIDWDQSAGSAKVRLKSTRDQTIRLALPPKLRLSRSEEIRLPANQEVSVAASPAPLT
jgi:alpha-L-fucosidase 2